ncbi:periostin isoform X2 [Rhinatrema bivittatum]|uniref:periostin isoform X2 n=1 Tax=Rhinatrema bivittatum TaxID=194408 RepID=UPI0011295A60|nr:periostin isoform X2 [Rhinatrema bivittatum]
MRILFLSSFAIVLLSAFDLADSSAYDKILSHSRIRARDKGPNVCALQQIMGTKKKYFSTCRNWHQRAICGKQAVVLYECCPGYMKIDGMQGCPAVAPIDHVYGTLGIVGATTTQDYSEKSDLKKEIEGTGSFTFFAPSNEAWQLLDPEIRSGLLSNVNIELLNALHYHMVNKRMLTKDLKNGITLKSMYNNQDLLINHYPNGVVTVNCARIIHGNQIATNGVVHVVDRVLTGFGNTIQDFIESEDDLSSLRAAAITSDVLDTLGKPGHYTLFAPTNDAFENLPRGVLERIMGDKTASEALMKFHILDSVQCSEAIMGGAIYDTLEGNTVEIGCDGDSLTVNGVKMVKRKDIVTSNGVIHLIDKVMIPDSAKQVMELAGPKQTTFTDLMAQLGLAASLKPEGEYTLLAPQNDAFSAETLRTDQRALKLILQNHILKKKIVLNELYNGQELQTLGNKNLRVYVYRTSVCIEDSCMLRGSKEGRNGAIHMFRKIIKPSETSLFDTLSRDKRFSMFLSLIESAGLKDMLTEEGAWTLFVPTNDAFKGLSEMEIETLKRDKVALQNILLYHLTRGVFIGGGFEPGVTNILKSIQGSKLMVKVINDTVSINDVQSKESDVMTRNGVIHVVDKLLFPADVPVGNEELLAILNKLIKYFKIKFVRGSIFREIPTTFYTTRIITKIITTKPEIKIIGGGSVHTIIKEEIPIQTISKVITGPQTVRKVIQEPKITTLTKVIEGQPEITAGSETRITKIIHGEPIVKTYEIEGTPIDVTKHGPEIKYTKIVTGGSDIDEEHLKTLLQEESQARPHQLNRKPKVKRPERKTRRTQHS